MAPTHRTAEARFKWKRMWHRAAITVDGLVVVDRWAPLADDNLDGREVNRVGAGRWNETSMEIEDHDLDASLAHTASRLLSDALARVLRQAKKDFAEVDAA